jgi:hypothetical protein
MSALIVLVILFGVVLFVTAPLRRARGADAGSAGELAELEAAREAKYREIRDLELDYRTGKLSSEDYEALDAQLRSEAIEILDRLERAEGNERGGAGGGPPGTP